MLRAVKSVISEQAIFGIRPFSGSPSTAMTSCPLGCAAGAGAGLAASAGLAAVAVGAVVGCAAAAAGAAWVGGAAVVGGALGLDVAAGGAGCAQPAAKTATSAPMISRRE